MLINVKKKKNVFHRTDGRTHVQLKTIVRNLTKKNFTDRLTDGRTTQNYSSEPHKNSNKKVEL